MKDVLSILSFVLCIIGLARYAFAIKQGSAKPSVITWIIWASVDTVTFAGMLTKHSINGQIVGAVLGQWIIVALIIKFGTFEWKFRDVLGLIGALLGLTLWYLFHEAVAGIIIGLSVAMYGSIATFKLAWKDPLGEDKQAWILFWISGIFAVIAIPHWTIEDAAQPIVFLFIEMMMIFIILIRPTMRSSKQ